MASGDVEETQTQIHLKKKYEKCLELYKNATAAFRGSQLSALDMLTLQFHLMKDAPVTFPEVIERRMENLQNRELRVYIAGEVAVGKSTFLNLLMGDNYLPTGHGSCTNIMCEVHNNEERRGIIMYEMESPKAIELTPDVNSAEWIRIRDCIKYKSDNQKNVSKVCIYWPLQICKNMHATEVNCKEESVHETRDRQDTQSSQDSVYKSSDEARSNNSSLHGTRDVRNVFESTNNMKVV